MKLYLSSYKLGDQSQQLVSWLPNKRIALISNALDFATDLERKEQSRQRDVAELRGIGLDPGEIDLRSYFGKKDELETALSQFDGIWLRGGNTFVLRRAMAYSGLDLLLQSLATTDFVYGGYSAGACVAAPTLRGIDLADDPEITPNGYQPEIIWDGLNFVPYCIAPHYDSDHPESALIQRSIQYFIDHQIHFVALRDGDVLLEEIHTLP